MLRFEYGLHIKPMTLQSYYKQCKVKYSPIVKQSSAKLKSIEDLIVKQHKFCTELHRHLTSNSTVVIYIDETSFHNWYLPRKVWQRPEDPVLVEIAATRGENFTLIGALTGPLEHKFLYQIYKTTNSSNTVSFIKYLLTQFDPDALQEKKLVLVLDNHRAHHSNAVRDLTEGKNIEILFLPPYSCRLNSIETVWAQVKQKWAKLVLTKMGKLTVEEGKEELKEICFKIQHSRLDRLYVANNKAVLEALEGKMV